MCPPGRSYLEIAVTCSPEACQAHRVLVGAIPEDIHPVASIPMTLNAPTPYPPRCAFTNGQFADASVMSCSLWSPGTRHTRAGNTASAMSGKRTGPVSDRRHDRG